LTVNKYFLNFSKHIKTVLQFVKSVKTRFFLAILSRFYPNFEQKFVKIQGLKSLPHLL